MSSTPDDRLTDHLCECGCGQRTKRALKTSTKHGWKKNEPLRFVSGHWKHPPKVVPKAKRKVEMECRCGCGGKVWVNPYAKGYLRGHHKRSDSPKGRQLSDHLCECGCGRFTYLAPTRGHGYEKGEPYRFLKGHRIGFRVPAPDTPPPNPHGLCMCGCGRTTPVAKASLDRLGYVKGQHLRYRLGHKPIQMDGYEVDKRTGCWHVPQGLNSSGYPSISRDGQRWMAHRYYYTEYVGPIPDGYVVHHECRNRACVNPDHLEAMPKGEHSRMHNLERCS